MVLEQYTSFFSLAVYMLLLLPAVVLGMCEKRIKFYGMFISIPILILIMGLQTKAMGQFIGFIVWEVLIIYIYQRLHQRDTKNFLYYGIFLLSILPLLVVKMSIFFSHVAGFIGVSYISFRVWQLLFEIQDRHIEKISINYVLYFITFFPVLSSGPIDRYDRFVADLDNKILKRSYINDYFILGCKKIFWGIIYKFAIAAAIHAYIIVKIPLTPTLESSIIYMYAYTFYLFFDFAGYSNFAIGTSYFLGIRSPENFNKPFLARDMKEFWDRWHISLSKWFGDYVFSRFVLNTLRSGIFKSKKTAVRCGYIFTMTLMGLWHGFYLYYVIYGIYQGLMLAFTDIYLKSKLYRRLKKLSYYDNCSRVICFQVIAFGMLLFSGYLFSNSK